MKKAISIITIFLVCAINLCGVLYFLNQNKENIVSLCEITQNRELYTISNNIDKEMEIEDFIKYIKTLKVSSAQSWYVYDVNNSCFLLYKDGPAQYIDENIKKVFLNFKTDYQTEKIIDSSNDENLITIKSVDIKDNTYLIAVSEYTQSIYSTIKNNNFNLYIICESALLSLLLIILFISYMIKEIDCDKQIEKVKNEFENYQKRFSDKAVGNIELPIVNENLKVINKEPRFNIESNIDNGYDLKVDKNNNYDFEVDPDDDYDYKYYDLEDYKQSNKTKKPEQDNKVDIKDIDDDLEIEQLEPIKNTKEDIPIQDEKGNYTPQFLKMLIPKLKENNVNFDIYEISADRFWIIDCYFKDNFYKIKKDEENLIILLIDGNKEQLTLLKEFGIKGDV